MNTKTSIVLGCSGQDGSLLCNSLVKKGEKVIGLTRSKQNQIKNHIKLGINKDVEIREGDISRPETIQYLIDHYQPNSIFNLASQSSVGKSFSHPTETLKSIIDVTQNILEISRKTKYNGKIFFAGSSEMFGNTEKAADITHQQNPISPYAIAKQASFNLVKLYRELHEINCVTGILFNHESNLRNENFISHKIILGAIECSRNRLHKIKIGNMNIYRDWGWAEEYVEAIQSINSSKKIKDYVVCTGKLTSMKDFIEIAFSKFDLNWKDHIVIDKKFIRKNDIKKSYGDPYPLSKDLNWKAKTYIEKIIENIINEKTKYLQF